MYLFFNLALVLNSSVFGLLQVSCVCFAVSVLVHSSKQIVCIYAYDCVLLMHACDASCGDTNSEQVRCCN